jgi:AraC-like DNA-binding protein
VTPAGVPHGYRAVAGDPWKLAWVIYTRAWQEGPALGRDRPGLIGVDPQPLADAIQGLYRESMGMAEPTTLHHWTHLVHTYAQRVVGPGTSDHRLRGLWETVDAHLGHPWTVGDLARQAGMSGEHLRRLCQDQLRRSPMRQVTALRMRRAAALLASESDTIEAVAQQVGYENAFAFSTAFKRHLGLSPTQYRGQKSLR